ncbi:MAG: ABC transporter permease [Pirellulales bacterium]|nr:ABC transporter permease [Pirellulales bacterium]
MKLSKNVVLSLEILAAHKLRTVLSVLGIVVGVAAVVVMVSISKGAEKRILDQIRAMGTNLVTVSAGQTRLVAGRQRQMTTVTTLMPADAQAIVQDCPSVAAVAPATSKKLAVRWETENTNTTVLGMTPEGFDVRDMALATGRLFDADEDRASRRVAVLGPTAVENLFGNSDPVGQTIRIGRVPFEVIGVIRPKGVDPNGLDQDDVIIVPLGAAMRRLTNVIYIQTVYVQAKDSKLLERAEQEIRDVLRRRHRLEGKTDDFTIQNQATLIAGERETAQSMTLLVGSVAGISLLVGGVGILAVMLISVRERVHEIGLRRAVGATRGDIRNQFLLESAILAALGGLAGVLIGVSATAAAATYGDWDAIISWESATVAFVFSVTLGIVFGLYPALRAASMEPIEALRAE